MRRTWMFVGVIVVIVMLVLVYFAFVGTSQPEDDINDKDDDPTDGDRTPTAYGIIHVKLMVDNAVGRYTGGIDDAYISVYDYISFDEGRVFKNQKWDPLGLFSDDMSAWITIKITGPGQFLFTWESDHSEFSLSEWGHKYIDFTTGRCFFWDQGSYSMTITGFADGDSGKFELGTKVTNFSVTV